MPNGADGIDAGGLGETIGGTAAGAGNRPPNHPSPHNIAPRTLLPTNHRAPIAQKASYRVMLEMASIVKVVLLI